MHKSLKNIALAGIAGVMAMTPALASAQAAPPADEAATAEQATTAEDPRLAALPAEKKAAIKAWPPETQAYYWTLTEERQKVFWALSDTDKVKLSQMPEEQRESTWAQIEARTAPPRG
ncbi:MAG: hypothetical protein ACKO1O_04650 [Erythrobacter sp.]